MNSLINSYTNCTINIIDYSNDEWGVKTRTVVYSAISARVEEKQKYIKKNNGVEILANTLIILDKDYSIEWNHKIQIVNRDGSSASLPLKEFAIVSLEFASSFKSSHWEIWL